MTTDARVIRAGRYAEIGFILQRDVTALINRWARRAAEEQPTARRVHHDVLVDELSELLSGMGRALQADGDHTPHRPVARRHAEQRWRTGWSLKELIRDYRILRLVVLGYLDETMERPLRLAESQAIGLALDEAVETSVEQYVRSQEEEAGRVQAALQEREEALRAADLRKNEFLATLAHELRNPLAPLRNSLEVVRLGGDRPDVFRQAREIMDRQVVQMTRLVEDLLDVSRIAQGKLALRTAPLDLRHAIEQAAQMNEPLVRHRRHRLAVELPAEPLCVEGDHARLVQVLVNLLNNAAKYTPEGGRITVAAARVGAEAVVRVSDNGAGIPADKLPLIFELFTQLDFGPDRPEGGLGIGLALVRRLVEMHGGAIAVASPGPGLGSEFTVRLPATESEPRAGGPDATCGPPAGRHILIVEDNRDGRDSLARLLSVLGHRVDVAEDGPGGVQAAMKLRPEVALIDIGLPGLDGYQVAARLRAALGSGVLLVALTGYAHPDDRQRAEAAGFDAHLSEPVELDDLNALLARPGEGQVTAGG